MSRLFGAIALPCLMAAAMLTATVARATSLRLNCIPSSIYPPSGTCFQARIGVFFTFWVIAIADDSSVDAGYVGTVHITSTDHGATLPSDYTFTATDKGMAPFVMAFRSAANDASSFPQTVVAVDVTAGITGSRQYLVFRHDTLAVDMLSTAMLFALCMSLVLFARLSLPLSSGLWRSRDRDGSRCNAIRARATFMRATEHEWQCSTSSRRRPDATAKT